MKSKELNHWTGLGNELVVEEMFFQVKTEDLMLEEYITEIGKY